MCSGRGPAVPDREVAMKKWIAAVRFGNHVTIFEASGGDYVRGPSTAPIWHPGGIAISRNSVLIGGNGCDYDGVVYQKGTDGNWRITGRMDNNQGECHSARPRRGSQLRLCAAARAFHAPGHRVASQRQRARLAPGWQSHPAVRRWRHNGPYVLQKSTAVAPSNFVFRRSGNIWTQTGKAVAANNDNTLDVGFDAVYRDGVLLTSEAVITSSPYAYLETSPRAVRARRHPEHQRQHTASGHFQPDRRCRHPELHRHHIRGRHLQSAHRATRASSRGQRFRGSRRFPGSPSTAGNLRSRSAAPTTCWRRRTPMGLRSGC